MLFPERLGDVAAVHQRDAKVRHAAAASRGVIAE